MIKRIPIFLFIIAIMYIYFRDDVFDNSKITIGSSMPQTGIIKAWGSAVVSGANSYFKYTNDNNILKNKKINFLVYDDKYEPELTIDNINKLIFQDEVFALFGFVGTPTVKNILPVLYDKEIPFVGAFTGASFLRNTKNNNFINFRSSYKEEIEALVSYLHDTKKLNKIAVFYQNDDYGEEGYISLINSLNKRDLSLVAEGSYKRNTLSINHAFHEIKGAKPEVIIMVGAYKTNSLFIKKAKESENLKDVIFCNISFGDANAMIKELEKLDTNTENLIFSQVVPSYTNEAIPVIVEYTELMNKYYPNEELGFISLEAFLSAKVLVNALHRIEGSLTRNKFLKALKMSPSNILEGMHINFKNTQLLNKVYLFEYDGFVFEEIKK